MGSERVRLCVCVWVKDSEANFKPDVLCGQRRSKAKRVEQTASAQTDELFFTFWTWLICFAPLLRCMRHLFPSLGQCKTLLQNSVFSPVFEATSKNPGIYLFSALIKKTVTILEERVSVPFVMSQRAISQNCVVAQLLVSYLFTVFIMCCYPLWFCDAGNLPTVGRMKDYLSYLILSYLILSNLILSYFLESGARRRRKGMAFITVGQFAGILKTLNFFLQLRIDKKIWPFHFFL